MRGRLHSTPERPRGARPDVAHAHARRAAARPVRLPCPRGPRGRGPASTTPSGPRSTGRVRHGWRMRPGRTTTRRCSTRRVRCSAPSPRRRRNGSAGDDDVRTYGHIVVDEAQDLSPMQLRMLNRRSLNGSMTVVGDIAQSTGAWAHADWDEVLVHLPDRRPPRRAELTIGYRLPGTNMRLAAKVLDLAAPGLRPPHFGAPERRRAPLRAGRGGRARRRGRGRHRRRAGCRRPRQRGGDRPGQPARHRHGRLRRGRRGVRPGRAQRPVDARSRWSRSAW